MTWTNYLNENSFSTPYKPKMANDTYRALLMLSNQHKVQQVTLEFPCLLRLVPQYEESGTKSSETPDLV